MFSDSMEKLTSRLGGSQGRSGPVRKISPPTGICFFVFSLTLFVLHPYLLLCLDCLAFWLSYVFTTRTSMPLSGFEPATPASDRPQTLAYHRSATGIGRDSFPGPFSPWGVAIPTELPRPTTRILREVKITVFCCSAQRYHFTCSNVFHIGNRRKNNFVWFVAVTPRIHSVRHFLTEIGFCVSVLSEHYYFFRMFCCHILGRMFYFALLSDDET